MRLAIAFVLLASCVISDDDEVHSHCGDGIVDTDETCDDGNGVADDGCTACVVDVAERMVNVTWTFRALATASETPCPAGAEDAEVSTARVDEAGAVIGSERSDPFPCSVGAGGIPVEIDQLGGLVRTSVRFKGPSGAWGGSLAEVVDVSAMDRDVPFVVFTDAGYVELTWELVGVSCADDEIDDIEITSVSAAKTYVDHGTCEVGQAMTGGVLAGTYDVTVRALSGDTEVAVATKAGVAVGDRNRVTLVGAFDLVAP